ncbi:hypothetical protein SLK20_01190 [Acinetobacter pittii]|nr:hypothetical protein [Acinetobacter pittii]MDX8157812.1 hypothetical protein [Acinetobacter pittii]
MDTTKECTTHAVHRAWMGYAGNTYQIGSDAPPKIEMKAET